jgi:hypothetical protein
MTRSETFKVVPEEAAGHKKEPHLQREPFIVVPAIVDHPTRTSADEEQVSYRNATGDGVVLETPI